MAQAAKAWKAEYARTGRSECRTCRASIAQDLLRLGMIVDATSFDGTIPEWHHAHCIFKKEGQIKSVDDVEGFDVLRLDDQQKIKLYINPRAADRKNPDEQTWRGFFRRLRDVLLSCGPLRAKQKVRRRPAGFVFSPALQQKLEEQNKAVWRLRDELKKQVKKKELREMLEANEQYSKGSENDLRERCADGMLFGALHTCHVCHSNSICLMGGQYRCQGYVDPQTRCSYSTMYPTRIEGKWRIPPGTKNKYLLEWFDSHEEGTSIRLFTPTAAESVPVVYDEGSLQNLKVAIAGKPTDEIDGLKQRLMEAGVKFHTRIKKDTSCLVWHGEMDDNNSDIKSARASKIPIVGLDYLRECLQRQKKLQFHSYTLKAKSPAYTEVVPVIVTEPAVHEDSGLQGTGHILKDGDIVYSTTLNKSDIGTDKNGYYILQIIRELGEDSKCHLFRKWGRTGYNTIGGSTKKEMPMSEAIIEFKRLFERLTGIPWESWKRNDDNFPNREGKYNPVNVLGPHVEYVPRLQLEGNSSQLPPQVKELMEWICNEQICRADYMKDDIDMNELPLGKISKARIDKGLETLNKISDILPERGVVHDIAVKRLITDLSNNYYNLIPSIHPRPISDVEDIQVKKNMLAELQINERFMDKFGISIEVDASMDENYKKLRCDVRPLARDSDDYKLVEKYFAYSQSPVHNELDLELEEVFEINREDEKGQNTIHNKMLLWHGTHLRNVLGILGQGLMIAPTAAPAEGYKFGEGLYFADFVSRSAQRCFVEERSAFPSLQNVDKGSLVLFLAEVALGDAYELTEYQMIEEIPQGKHSIKGVGWVKPSEKGYMVWHDDHVAVPCGKPTASRVKSQLPCNEYVVKNTAQAKLRFLVKVKFRLRDDN